MERNRWETAIRCLEIAAHPSTSDKEVIAAVNGFRRTADRAPLIQLCREFAGAGQDNSRPPAFTPAWKETLERLARENFELRQRVEEIEDSRTAALRRLREAEQRAQEIGGELLAAEHRADTAEQQLAKFRGGSSADLQREDLDLRRAFTEARRDSEGSRSTSRSARFTAS